MDIKEQYEDLTRKLKGIVPFKAFPIRELVQELRTKDIVITLKTEITIVDVYNSGDISGIFCTAKYEGEKNIACGLVHLGVSTKTPFYKEIVDYQKKRAKRIRKMNQ